MKKKKRLKHKHIRNAAPRNAAPRAPRSAKVDQDTPTRRLGYTAAGAAGSALLGAFLARQGWAPKTVSGALAAVGAGLAWKGEGNTVRSVGAGAMSGAGAQLALLVLDDHETKKNSTQEDGKKKPATEKRLANEENLPPGAVEAAFYRARDRLATAAAEQEDIS